MSRDKADARVSGWIVLAMLAMVAIPAGITLHTVHAPVIAQPTSGNPTPYGYSCSLLLFIVPVVVIGLWFLPSEGIRISQRAFWRTVGILVPLGCGLDFFCATRFFTFSNAQATLGINVPVFGGSVPVEEYVFYFTGFLAVLLIYIWLDAYWLAAYKTIDPSDSFVPIPRLLWFHFSSVAAGISLIAIAIAYKRLFSPVPDGFPWYFTVLVIGGLVPSAAFFPTARKYINWRAFSLTLFIILLISMFWEATLAVPYGWWGYQPRQMMGLFIGAWTNLPLEAVTVWIAVTYGTVIVYEVVRLWQASGRRFRDAMLGLSPEPARSATAERNSLSNVTVPNKQ